VTVAGCTPGGASPAGEPTSPRDPALALAADPARKRTAAQITSTFENSTTELQYGYAEDIGDGRGITAGRAGFTSGTGDLLEVVHRYTAAAPGNPLAGYLPALEQVDGTDSLDGLEGLESAWTEAAQDPAFRQLQDDVVDELYFDPAMDLAAGVGVASPLGQAVIWDAMIQHGAGGPDGTQVLLAGTTEQVGRLDEQSTAAEEAGWLEVFLDVRLEHLLASYAPTLEDGEASLRSRIEALRSLVRRDELALDLPVDWEVYGDSFTLPPP
jgi:chitosanase